MRLRGNSAGGRWRKIKKGDMRPKEEERVEEFLSRHRPDCAERDLKRLGKKRRARGGNGWCDVKRDNEPVSNMKG